MTGKVDGGTVVCDDSRLHDIVLVDQLPQDFWFEGIAIRPSGNVLIANIKDPELLAVDATSEGPPEDRFRTIPPRIVHTFPDANGAFNICALPGTKREEYAVVSGHADPAKGDFHSFMVWRVVMPPEESDDAPEVSKIGDLPDVRFATGLVAISERTLAIADSSRGCIWRFDVPSGQPSVLFEDPNLAPPPSGEDGFFGVGRVRFTEKYGWAVNTGFGTLYRFPIEYVDGGKDLKVTGPIEPVVTGLVNADGMVMTRGAREAYICSYMKGHLWRVDLDSYVTGDLWRVDTDGDGKGSVSVVRSDLVSPTTMELVYPDKGGKPTLYIVCCHPLSQEMYETSVNGSWLDLTNVDRSKLEVTITVTTEVTYEYI